MGKILFAIKSRLSKNSRDSKPPGTSSSVQKVGGAKVVGGVSLLSPLLSKRAFPDFASSFGRNELVSNGRQSLDHPKFSKNGFVAQSHRVHRPPSPSSSSRPNGLSRHPTGAHARRLFPNRLGSSPSSAATAAGSRSIHHSPSRPLCRTCRPFRCSCGARQAQADSPTGQFLTLIFAKFLYYFHSIPFNRFISDKKPMVAGAARAVRAAVCAVPDGIQERAVDCK